MEGKFKLLSYWGLYLNFSAWFMKNVLFEQKKNMKLPIYWHFVEVKQRLYIMS
jgi:hypothetical protein